MANTQGICDSFKKEVMQGIHAFGDGTGVPARSAGVADTLKGALYFATATVDHTTTAYSATGEVGNSGTYSAGGVTLTTANPPIVNSTSGCFTPSASFVVTGFTAASFDCLLVYNSSQSNKAIGAYTFGSQSITAGTFTLTMPANAIGTALIELA